MSSLSDAASAEFVRLIYIGDSGTGKTGSLTSLVDAGYKLRILDLDCNISPLKTYVLKNCPGKIGNVDVESRRDMYRSTPTGPQVVGMAKAFTDSLALMTKWSDGTVPAEWGKDTIFVLDTLSAYGRAAFQWAKQINFAAGGKGEIKDPRPWYFMAQQAIEDTLALITNDAFHCHVIVISHINYQDVEDGQRKGGVNSVGKAQMGIIPRYFPTLVSAEISGVGKFVKRKIRTMPTGVLDLKTPLHDVDETYPLETGLATLFEKLRAI